MARYIAPRRHVLDSNGSSLNFSFQDKTVSVRDIELSLNPVIGDNALQTSQIEALNTLANNTSSSLSTTQNDVAVLQSNVTGISASVANQTDWTPTIDQMQSEIDGNVVSARDAQDDADAAAAAAANAMAVAVTKQNQLSVNNKLHYTHVLGYNG